MLCNVYKLFFKFVTSYIFNVYIFISTFCNLNIPSFKKTVCALSDVSFFVKFHPPSPNSGSLQCTSIEKSCLATADGHKDK